MAWLTGWNYRKKLTLDSSKIDSDCSDFPVKVIMDEDNFDFSKALSTGNDVRFTASDGETLLKYERELHDEVNPNAIRVIDGYSLGAGNITREADHWVFSVTTGTELATRILVSAEKIDMTNISKIKVNWEKVDPTYEWSRPYLQISNNQMGDRTDYVAQFDAHGTYGSGLWGPATNELDVSAYSGSYYIKLIGALTIKAWYGHTQKVYDIWLEDADGNKIKQGMEYVTVAAVYHVKIPTVSSTSDTDIYMYYGKADASDGADPTNVWDSNYELVMHMDSSLEDSTSNGNDGTNSGTTAGIAGDGHYRSFDGVDDYIYVADDNTLDLSAGLTVEAYAEMNDIETAQALVVKDQADGASPYCLDIYPDVLRFFGYESTTAKGITSGSGAPASNTRYLNYGKKDGGSWAVGRNGSADATKSESATLNNTSDILSIGARYYSSQRQRWFGGKMYEVRISSTARSDAWIKATYHSLADTLLTYGSETARPRVMVVWA